MSAFEQVVYGIAIYYGLCWVFDSEDLVTTIAKVFGLDVLVLSFIEGYKEGYEDDGIDGGSFGGGVDGAEVAVVGDDQEIGEEPDAGGLAGDLYQGDDDDERRESYGGGGLGERGGEGLGDKERFKKGEREVRESISIRQLKVLGRKYRIVGYGKMSYEELMAKVIEKGGW